MIGRQSRRVDFDPGQEFRTHPVVVFSKPKLRRDYGRKLGVNVYRDMRDRLPRGVPINRLAVVEYGDSLVIINKDLVRDFTDLI